MSQLSFFDQPALSLRPLRPKQAVAIDAVRQAIREGHKRIILQAPCGFGKTVVASWMVAGALEKAKRPLFAVPRLSLIGQTVRRFEENGISDIGVIQGQHERTDFSAAVQVASVQTLVRRPLPEIDFVIIDECHVQFEALNKILDSETWKDKVVIGLSATPWVKGMGLRWTKLIVPGTTNEMIAEGWLTPVVGYGVPDDFMPDVSKVHTNFDGDYVEGEAEKAMTTNKIIGNVVATWLDKGPGEKTFMFCVNRSHARKMQKEFEDAGVACGYIDGTMDAYEREVVFRRYRSGELKIIASIDTVGIGVDEDVRCIIYLRLTKSEMKWCLDSETEILTSHGWKRKLDVRVGDCAASSDDVISMRGCWSPITDVVRRPMTASETWIEYHAPRADFRVTDNHRLIVAPRLKATKHREEWRIVSAELATKNGGMFFPTAVHMRQQGVPLTDAELYFIGMMMTDGTWTSHKANISQSERHPEIVSRIEKCLADCGIGYSKRRVFDKKENMVERFPRWRYCLSMDGRHNHRKGLPSMASKYEYVPGVRGWRYLLPYLDKDLAPSLFQMSQHQLIKLIEGIWDGDGSKMQTADWTPRSWTFVSVRQTFLDRLQALCAINGFTASINKPQTLDRNRPLLIMSITPKDWRHCGGYGVGSYGGNRPVIASKPWTDEDVWCVTTQAGTIVTRRRGKVTVMGNCQDGGRGIRIADGKESLLLLDHAGTAEELGIFTDIHHDTLDTRDPKEKGAPASGNAPKPRKCPKCNALVRSGATVCPVCGAMMGKGKTPRQMQGELVAIGKKEKKPEKDEKQLWYSQALGLAQERNYAEGWAAHLYKDRWGVWPRGLQRITAFPTRKMREFERQRRTEYWQQKQKEGAA